MVTLKLNITSSVMPHQKLEYAPSVDMFSIGPIIVLMKKIVLKQLLCYEIKIHF